MYVCEDCIEDSALQEFVRTHLVSGECTYCERVSENAIAANLEDVLKFMDDVISEEYDDPNEGMSYISAEGGWQGQVLEGGEIFDEIGFGLDNEQLFDEIEAHFAGRLFCERDHQILNPSDRMLFAWERFKHVVQHERRYTFWTSHDDGEEEWHPDHLPPSHMLREIAEILREIDPYTTLNNGATIWRARVHDSEFSPNSPKAFTSPPVELARQPNRMSPAGVPMFYGCADQDTAYQETVEPDRLKGKTVSAACFKALRPLRLLDLTANREPASFFSVGRKERHAIRFLQGFAKSLSQPITRDGSQHIDYVPTQVFTEYVRYELKTSDDNMLDGIVYNSSKNKGVCYVIFATQEDCLPKERHGRPQLLEYVEGSILTISMPSEASSRVGEFTAIR